MSKPTCLIGGMFNYDTITWKENRKAPEQVMAHEVGGKVEFFRGCPESWNEVSFENLALSDGRRVSGRRVNGKILIDQDSAPAKTAE